MIFLRWRHQAGFRTPLRSVADLSWQAPPFRVSLVQFLGVGCLSVVVGVGCFRAADVVFEALGFCWVCWAG